jgi:hypothetical protein
LFRKPSIADIYIQQLSTRFHRAFVPLYPPNAAEIRVGTIGRFIDGEFDRRGHLADRLGGEDAFDRTVAMAKPSAPSAFVFQSANSVRIEPLVDAAAAAQNLLTASLCFTGNRAVVASFIDVVEHTVRSPSDFDKLLWRMHLDGRLAHDEVVVWVHRQARLGTVMVNRKGGVDIQLVADPNLVGAVISLASLGAGVQLGVGSSVSAYTTGPALTVAVKAKGLSKDDAIRIEDSRGFQASTDERMSNFRGLEIPSVTAKDVIDAVDFDAPED